MSHDVDPAAVDSGPSLPLGVCIAAWFSCCSRAGIRAAAGAGATAGDASAADIVDTSDDGDVAGGVLDTGDIAVAVASSG